MILGTVQRNFRLCESMFVSNAMGCVWEQSETPSGSYYLCDPEHTETQKERKRKEVRNRGSRMQNTAGSDLGTLVAGCWRNIFTFLLDCIPTLDGEEEEEEEEEEEVVELREFVGRGPWIGRPPSPISFHPSPCKCTIIIIAII